MNKSILKELLNNYDDGPFVSVIVSTELKSFSDKERIRLKFKNILTELTNNLHKKYEEKQVEFVIRSLTSLIEHIDLNHLQKGVGIFVSVNFTKLIYFPLPVEDKVLIDSYFDVSDIIETLDKMVSYSVLLLSKNKARLFEGNGNSLLEISDVNFPRHFENEFQVQRSSTHSLYNNEKSKIDNVRVKDYFRKIDKLLKQYINNEPIVLLGVTEHLSKFKSVSKHKTQIVAELEGNFDKCTAYIITQLVWPEIENYGEKNMVLDSSHF
jgi:hypothetical protein